METVSKVLLMVVFIQFYSDQCFANLNGVPRSSTACPFNASTITRHRRYLDFLPKSRMFFRANIKANVLSANQILAFAYGYRANYPIENDRKIRRRDVYDSVEEMMNNHGIDGATCILKIFCEVSQSVTDHSGMFYKLFKLIFALQRDDAASIPFLTSNSCTEVNEQCPLQKFTLSPYTDI